MASRQREQWDAIVVGSGLGGLACGAYLTACGKRTLVLEAHSLAGGNSQVFRREHEGRCYEFDVGVHYIGECGPDGVITCILQGIGLAGRIRFRPLDPDGFSTLVFPDLRFRVPVGWDRYRERLLAAFPDEAEPLGRVVDLLRQVAEGGRRFMNKEIGLQEMAAQAPAFMAWGLRPISELLAEHGLSQRASAVLLGEQGTYAVRPSKTPVVLQAGVTDHYMRGAYYPEGGGQVIPGCLVQAIRAHGGEVRLRAPVKRVRIENGRVAGVVLEWTDEVIDAPVVVSNADLKRTLCELVGAEYLAPQTVERVRAYRMALPLFIVYIGLKADLAKRGVPNTNYLLWDTYDIEGTYAHLEAGRIPAAGGAYVTITSLKDPGSGRLAPEGYSNLQIMTVVPRDYGLWHAQKGPSQGTQYRRDPRYRSRKEELTERLIGIAERVLPGIRNEIDWQESATPLTQERYTHSTGGTSYGIEFACDQMGPMRMGPETEIPGLYLCGASTPSGHGIGSVLRSGVIAAGTVLGKDLIRAVLSGEIFGDTSRLPEVRDDWDPWQECR